MGTPSAAKRLHSEGIAQILGRLYNAHRVPCMVRRAGAVAEGDRVTGVERTTGSQATGGSGNGNPLG